MSAEGNGFYIAYEQVEVRYTDLVSAIEKVDLGIGRGEFVFLCGRTGAGKSTLLKLLSREVKHTGGRVWLRGRDLSDVREGEIAGLRRQMGIVPQDFALLPRKKVWENVAYAMRAVGHTKREVRRKVPEFLEKVNIAQRADAYPHQLSGGERQRVAIARALINNPPLLLADEPTGNLDPEHSWEIMEILANLNLRGTTVLVASHDMMVVERMGKRIVTLEDGKISSDSGPVAQPVLLSAPSAEPVQAAPAPVAAPEPAPDPPTEEEEPDVR